MQETAATLTKKFLYQSIPGLDHAVFKHKGFIYADPAGKQETFWVEYLKQNDHRVIVTTEYLGDRIKADGSPFALVS